VSYSLLLASTYHDSIYAPLLFGFPKPANAKTAQALGSIARRLGGRNWQTVAIWHPRLRDSEEMVAQAAHGTALAKNHGVEAILRAAADDPSNTSL
jgi:hypothetical protein